MRAALDAGASTLECSLDLDRSTTTIEVNPALNLSNSHRMATIGFLKTLAREVAGDGITVNIEYVSANPTGPMHMGHCRGAVVGDALASLLEFAGHRVIREYYVNDAGGQVDVLARAVHLRYREALGETVTIPVIWGGLTSEPTCTAPRVSPPAGSYVVRGRLDTKASPDAPLTLS